MTKPPRIKKTYRRRGHPYKRWVHDFTETDEAILRVLSRAKRPLLSREIRERGRIHPLNFDCRLQALKHKGLIEVHGRTSGATWSLVRFRHSVLGSRSS